MKTSQSPLPRPLQFLGKVQFTMILLILGVVVMTVGTIIESRESRELAQFLVYKTFWFDTFLFFIALNLVISVVNRVPIQRHQWAFVMVHASILLLLIGSWISRTYGYEGQMRIYEGSEESSIFTDANQIRAQWVTGSGSIGTASARVAPGDDLTGHQIQEETADQPGIRFLEHVPLGKATARITEGQDTDPPGFQFVISGAGQFVSDWFIAEGHRPSERDMGPVEVEIVPVPSQAFLEARLNEERKTAGFRVVLSSKTGSDPIEIPLPESEGKEISLADGSVVKIVQFFMNAKLLNNELVDKPSTGVNPAAIIEIRSGTKTERHVMFSKFPNYNAVHDPEGKRQLAYQAKLVGEQETVKPRLSILIGPGDQLHLQLATEEGVEPAVPFAAGTKIPLSSSGINFEITKYFAHARSDLTVRPAAKGSGGEKAYINVEVSRSGETKTAWMGYGMMENLALAGQSVRLLFVDEMRSVPFAITLKEFELVNYPGSSRPAEYRSQIRIRPVSNAFPPRDEIISMNRPLDEMGFRLFQSSYILATNNRPDATILTVSHDPGVPVVYISFVLIVIGIAWYLRNQSRIARLVNRASSNTQSVPLESSTETQTTESTEKKPMKKTATLAILGLLLGTLFSIGVLSSSAHAEGKTKVSVEATRGWAILADGRVKPLLTYANETILSITGRKGIDGLNSVDFLWGYAMAPTEFRTRPYIRVDSPALKAELGLSTEERRYSFDAIMNHPKFQTLARAAFNRQDSDIPLSPLDKDVLGVYGKLSRISSLMSGDSLSVIPVESASGSWSNPVQIQRSPDPKQQAIGIKFMAFTEAYIKGDEAAFTSAANELGQAFRNVNPSAYPSQKVLDRELFSEDFNAFGKSWKFYLAGTLLLFLLGFSTKRWLYFSALGLLIAGFACHSLGIGIRWSIAGRAPVSNMYESLTFMGWGVMAFGLMQEAIYRKRFFALAGGLMSFICLAFSENLPIDSSISPLVPVLAHTSWLAIHVITIMLSYSALALAMGLGHFALFVQLWRPNKVELMRSLALLLYNTLQVGLLFLAAGIIGGAVWANESWGRYWGWDPKETWSLITFFVYLAIVHARFAGWLADFGLAASSIIGFLSVVMTYYGVNFILAAGMHSYGFSEGGQIWVIVYAVVEIAIIVGAFVRYRQVKPAPTPEPAE